MSRVIAVSLGASSLPYATLCISSLAENLKGEHPIHLLTDTPRDHEQLAKAFAKCHRIKVILSDVVWERDGNSMKKYRGLETLRQGHYCWRKLTDPMLLANDGDEIVVVDPDVYFPRPFDFETVEDATLRLMWQRPNCLLPYSVVQKLFDKKIALADHVDIGIAQYRAPLDLEWLDWLVKSLGDLPLIMHVEAIFWAALAMRMGGGYLNPDQWSCWSNTQWKRVQMKFGFSPLRMLQGEDLSHCLAFHAGGTAKRWLTDPGSKALLERMSGTRQVDTTRCEVGLMPFKPYTAKKFAWLKRRSNILSSVGYYRMLGAKPSV